MITFTPLKDASLIVTTALPAAGASVSSTNIDLGAVVTEVHQKVRISVPATPSLVENETIIIKVQDSATTTGHADTPGRTFTVTGAALAAGGVATELTDYLPPDCGRYICATATVSASAGSNIAVSFTIELCFDRT